MSHYESFVGSWGERDAVFAYVLSLLGEQPANILEIGVARDLSLPARRSDGWSSMHLGIYASKHGSHLDCVDISDQSLKACASILDSIPVKPSYTFHLSDGSAFLRATEKRYGLILLDGSDDPGEMLSCFEVAKSKSDYILCDDFHSKGTTLRSHYRDFLLFKWHGNPHELSLYGCGKVVVPEVRYMNDIGEPAR